MLHNEPRMHTRMRPRVARQSAAPGSTRGMVVPYDYAASFELKGQPGNIVQDVINVSTDGVFVATAIGYGFEERRARPMFDPLSSVSTTAVPFFPGDFTLGQIPLPALIEGFRINPQFESLVFDTPQSGLGGGAAGGNVEFSNQEIDIRFFGSRTFVCWPNLSTFRRVRQSDCRSSNARRACRVHSLSCSSATSCSGRHPVLSLWSDSYADPGHAWWKP